MGSRCWWCRQLAELTICLEEASLILVAFRGLIGLNVIENSCLQTMIRARPPLDFHLQQLDWRTKIFGKKGRRG